MAESKPSGDNGIPPGQHHPESTVHRPRSFPPRPDFLEIDERQTLEQFRDHLDVLKGLDTDYAAIMDASPTVRRGLESLFAHSKWTARHSAETGYMAFVVAKKSGLEGKRLQDFVEGATLHDMGKVVVTKEILDKTDRLDMHEEQEMNAHPAFSFVQVFSPENPRPALVALGHHSQQERPYPFDAREENPASLEEVRHMVEGLSASLKGLYGEEFNEEGYNQLSEQLDVLYPQLLEEWKMVTAADIVHSLRSNRPYKGSFPEDFIMELKPSFPAGTIDMVDTLLQAYRQIPTLHGENDPIQPQNPSSSPSNT